jgi:hypothetical protein
MGNILYILGDVNGISMFLILSFKRVPCEKAQLICDYFFLADLKTTQF